jgi:cytosine deaminase
MRVAIAGGHGKIALRLTRLLRDNGDEVISLIRNADHSADVEEAGGEPRVLDLEAVEEGEVAEAIRGADAVVFAAGAGPGSGSARKWTMDYGGAVKLMGAAEAEGISRYVIVSSMGADPELEGQDTFSVYQRAKGQADAELQASGLEYTIVRPGLLTDEPGSGHIRVTDERGEISRDDVASVLDVVLHNPATTGWTFGVIAGDTPVGELPSLMSR